MAAVWRAAGRGRGSGSGRNRPEPEASLTEGDGDPVEGLLEPMVEFFMKGWLWMWMELKRVGRTDGGRMNGE